MKARWYIAACTAAICLAAAAGIHGVLATPQLALAAAYKTTAQCSALAGGSDATSRKHLLGDPVCGALDGLSLALAGRVATPLPVAVAGAAVYPLQLSSNGRYLVDQQNLPFLMVGDSPQALVGAISEEDAELFFSNRQKYGFNSVWVNLLCNEYTGCPGDGRTFDGVAPFTTSGDLTTPNEAYFARVDRLIDLANTYGINVILDPIETGGWMGVLQANGPDNAHSYGVYLGRRYARFSNIVWMHGNDFQSWRDPNDDALVLAVARGIRQTDPVHLETLELDYYVSSSLDDERWASVVQLDAAYTYSPTYAEVLRDYNRANFKPVFLVETNYEFEHDYSGPATLRRQEYWALLSGAAGQIYGNKYTWPFLKDWKSHLDTIGSVQVTYATNLFASRRWYDLVPDQLHRLVTSSPGTYSDTGNVNDSDYVTAAATPDGTLAVIYTPTERTLTVDLTRLSGQVQARWYDPASGTYAPASETALPNTGTRDFRTPGQNSGGDNDWLLLLEVSN